MKKTFLAVIIGIALMVPSLAFADSSSCQAYNKNCSNNTTSTASTTTSVPPSTGATTAATTAPTATAGTTASQSTLPFTGLDLVALVSGGSVLLGAGLVVRRLSRDPD